MIEGSLSCRYPGVGWFFCFILLLADFVALFGGLVFVVLCAGCSGI